MRTAFAIRTMLVVAVLAARSGPALAGGVKMDSIVEATLNGLHFTLDARSGSILKLTYPGVGTLLASSVGRASIIDLACPMKEFEPLRLASRYSSEAQVTPGPDSLTIHWDRLGPSRSNYALQGSVSATVRFKALPDGKSIAISAEVTNQSDVAVRQVLFPDFQGLLPSCGEDGTWFRSCGSASLPFHNLAMTEEKEARPFMEEAASLAIEHKSGTLYDGDMVLRWLDFGGLGGGFSLFPEAWGWDRPLVVRLQRSEVEAKLRMSVPQYVDLKRGDSWRSPEYVLTPHAHGWAAGIGPFRAWVHERVKRDRPVPRRVREGLGFRTIWMCQNRPSDPQDRIFRFADLPKLAREGKEHGLRLLVCWAWSDFFTLPLPGPYPHLGSEKDMADSVRECASIDVEVAPFISVLSLKAAAAPRYSARVEGTGGWTYHTELIPRFNPPYASGSATVEVGPTNPKWQEDVVVGTRRLVDFGIPAL